MKLKRLRKVQAKNATFFTENWRFRVKVRCRKGLDIRNAHYGLVIVFVYNRFNEESSYRGYVSECRKKLLFNDCYGEEYEIPLKRVKSWAYMIDPYESRKYTASLDGLHWRLMRGKKNPNRRMKNDGC